MTAPPTPQRKSTFRSRVGGAIRRSSTTFSIPGLPVRTSSSTPPPPQDSDTVSVTGSASGKLDQEGSTTSVSKIDTIPPVSVSSTPSPILESPAREAAALAAEPQPAVAKAPSSLADEVPKADAASKQGSTPTQSVTEAPTPPAAESVPAEAPPISQRKSTFRSRLGGAMRRSSTAFIVPSLPNRESSSAPSPRDSDAASVTGSVSGKPDREGSETSVNKIDTTPIQPPVSDSSAPSPIPESPAREAAALAAEPQPALAKAPPSLANEVLEADVAYKQGSTSSRSVSRTPPPPAAQSVHARAPPTSQRKSTFRSRVGGAIRRSSTAFSIPGLPSRGGSATPPPLQDSDTASIAESVSGKLDREGPVNKIDTTPLQPPASVKSAPSPIAESPAREAAALVADPQPAAVQAPSPLANEVLEADAASKQGSTPPQSVSGTPPAAVESVPVKPSVIAERQSSQMYDSPNEQKDERYSVSDVYNNQAPNSSPVRACP